MRMSWRAAAASGRSGNEAIWCSRSRDRAASVWDKKRLADGFGQSIIGKAGRGRRHGGAWHGARLRGRRLLARHDGGLRIRPEPVAQHPLNIKQQRLEIALDLSIAAAGSQLRFQKDT